MRHWLAVSFALTLCCAPKWRPAAMTFVRLEEVRCNGPEGPPTCAFTAGGIGCCTTGADGAKASWVCPKDDFGLERPVHSPQPIGALVGAAHVVMHSDHLCARMLDGTVRCLGSAKNGNLAQGSYATMEEAITVIGINGGFPEGFDPREVGAGRCARFGDATVRCGLGSDDKQRPGPDCRAIRVPGGGMRAMCDRYDASILCRATPVALAVPGLRDVRALFGDCAVLSDGSVRCWGENKTNRLALSDGPSYGIPVPVALGGLQGAVRQVAATCAVLDADGAVQCWGDVPTKRKLWQLETMSGVEELVFSHTEPDTGCARVRGRVLCWADEALVPIPADAGEPERFLPRLVKGLGGVTQVAIGRRFACALAGGRVACWGSNEHGQLGDGKTAARLDPAPVQGLTDVVQLAVADDSACARTQDGRVACWGWLPVPLREQLVPELVRDLPRAARLAAGPAAYCALDEHGVPWCWGVITPPPGPAAVTPASAPTLPAVAAEDLPSRPAPPPHLTCTREPTYVQGDTWWLYGSEDECLDRRAQEKLQVYGRCQRSEHFVLSSDRADGQREWSCSCAGAQCLDQQSQRLAPECGRDPDTGQPYSFAELDALCRARVADAPRGAASRHRARYCVNAYQEVIGDCHPVPGQGCIAPRGVRAAWLCFRDAVECERTRSKFVPLAKQGAPLDTACTVVDP